MKIIVLLAAMIGKALGDGFKLRGLKYSGIPAHAKRQLEMFEEPNFLISVREGDNGKEEYWCIESGTDHLDEATISRCDFETRPASQLWFEDYGDADSYDEYRIRSASDQSKCLQVGFDGSIGENTRVRMGDCDDEGFNYFTNDWLCEGYCTRYNIRVANADGSYCVTNQGVSPRQGENMKVKTCNDKDRFQWVGTSLFGVIHDDGASLTSKDFCVALKDGATEEFNELRLQRCTGEDLSKLWLLDNKGMIHSALRYDKCIMVGYGNVVDVGDSKRLRIGDCNEYRALNGWQWVDFEVHPKAYEGYCMTLRGSTKDYGDPVIIKDCDTIDPENKEWSAD